MKLIIFLKYYGKLFLNYFLTSINYLINVRASLFKMFCEMLSFISPFLGFVFKKIIIIGTMILTFVTISYIFTSALFNFGLELLGFDVHFRNTQVS